MYYQVEQVLEQQEPEIEKFYKGRGLLICEAKQGLFALKEYFGSAQKAEFLYWLGICLEQQGILCDSMLKNKDGSLITEGPDRIPYTFHRWVRGRECEVKNRTELLETVSFLADFHRCCSESGVEQDKTDFELNIRKLVKQFNLQAQRVRIAARTDETAQRRSDVARKLYLLGKSTILDLNASITEKDQARRNYITALYNYWSLYYTLRSLTLFDFEGKTPLTENYDLLID